MSHFSLERHQLTVSHDAAARALAALFKNNFRAYEAGVGAEIQAAGPA
jgi:hypothetical protein